jgi:hypothetical protein
MLFCQKHLAKLRNVNGAILQHGGAKVGVEVSAAVGGVTVRLK